MSAGAIEFYAALIPLWQKLDAGQDEVSELAGRFLQALGTDPHAQPADSPPLPEFFALAVRRLWKEYDSLAAERPRALEQLKGALKDFGEGSIGIHQLQPRLWRALFPEALHLDDNPQRQIDLLRSSRIVNISQPVADPLTDPAAQIIFTSNVLLSPPLSAASDNDELSPIVRGAMRAADEPQLYWFDHPIPIGVEVEHDETLYGLRGLARAVRYEKNRGTMSPDEHLNVFLSVSVTHAGLRHWARPWLRERLGSAGAGAKSAQPSGQPPSDLAGLSVRAFTEEDARGIAELLVPWLPDGADPNELIAVFGVDGEYGRHYTFLKALPALCSVLVDPQLKGTFKIDLDQIFPQERLVSETGKSALEHFMTPLWGAQGHDEEGREVELGMIAGALVNESQIARGLFTPDIPWPEDGPAGDQIIFFKQLPMAVSTRAEMMTRYGSRADLDGRNQVLHRIHVTGGTNGIRFDALRRQRPFTPTFVGRAEDQAYILSVLHGAGGQIGESSPTKHLRYFHASGLTMRHDKKAFAGAAVKAGKAGSYIGDLVRLFVFSAYADCLPGGRNAIKKTIDPFTGCFVTPIPATLAMLTLALRLRGGGSESERRDLMDLAASRLGLWIADTEKSTRDLHSRYQTERRAWETFYKALDNLETALSQNNKAALDTASAFAAILDECRVLGP